MTIKPDKVLVVDDDPIIRDMMVEMLSLEGYPTLVARNGREALEKLHGEESYLVFLDLMMPIMDGYELCQRLSAQQHIRRRHVIVIMSAMDKLAQANSLDFDAAMPKPFSIDDVLHVMEPYTT